MKNKILFVNKREKREKERDIIIYIRKNIHISKLIHICYIIIRKHIHISKLIYICYIMNTIFIYVLRVKINLNKLLLI